MATTYEEYLKQVNAGLAPSKEQEKKAQTELIDSQIGTVKDNYNQKIADTNESYETAAQKNAVQKMINERQLAERMANLGLTDSGLNRTQQTAVQLSYANQSGELSRQRQKAIDNLAAAMTSEITGLENQKATKLAAIDEKYSTTAAEQATKLYNNEVTAEADMYKAGLEAEENKYKNMMQDKLTLIRNLNKVDKNEDGERTAYYSDDAKKALVRNYISVYGVDPDFLASIGYEKLAYEDWGSYEWALHAKALLDKGMTPADVSDELDRLEEKGFITSEHKKYALKSSGVTERLFSWMSPIRGGLISSIAKERHYE